MRYFKASITIENSEKKYGNLPLGFVLGYENENLNEVYFCLLDEVVIPENSQIEEIDVTDYESAIETINQIANTKRESENEAVNQIIIEKERIIENLNSRVEASENVLADLILGGM